MNTKVDWFFNKAKTWRDEYDSMRTIALDCGLTEELKWGCPCYTSEGRNIVLIHGFKEYCAFLFFKGALLKDPSGILVQQTQNVQAARQVRFTHAGEITKLKATLKAYIREAVKVEKAGLKVDLKKTNEFTIPEEFQHKLDKDRALRTAFYRLTPGRQRGYILFFSAPKQSKTREARIEKSTKDILNGIGLNDK